MQPQHNVIMIREVVAGANKCQMLTNRRQSCEKVKVITMLYGLISNHSDISCRKYLLRYFSFIFLLFQTKRYIEYRVDIWHDRCNWQSHKILVTCVNFSENNANLITISSQDKYHVCLNSVKNEKILKSIKNTLNIIKKGKYTEDY